MYIFHATANTIVAIMYNSRITPGIYILRVIVVLEAVNKMGFVRSGHDYKDQTAENKQVEDNREPQNEQVRLVNSYCQEQYNNEKHMYGLLYHFNHKVNIIFSIEGGGWT